MICFSMEIGHGPVSLVMTGPVLGNISVKGSHTVYLGNTCIRMLAGEAISGSFKSIFS